MEQIITFLKSTAGTKAIIILLASIAIILLGTLFKKLIPKYINVVKNTF